MHFQNIIVHLFSSKRRHPEAEVINYRPSCLKTKKNYVFYNLKKSYESLKKNTKILHNKCMKKTFILHYSEKKY